MGATVPYQMGGACQICEFIMTQGHAFGMFRCKQQCINALETYRRHIPTLWRYCVYYPDFG